MVKMVEGSIFFLAPTTCIAISRQKEHSNTAIWSSNKGFCHRLMVQLLVGFKGAHL